MGNQLTFADIQIPDNLEPIDVLEKPQFNIETFNAEPRIITERVQGDPVYMREELIEPIRQRVVIQPQINQRVEKLVPIFQKQQQRVQLKNENLPPKFTS